MEEHKAYSLKYEVADLKRGLTLQFPISEPTIRQTFLRILTLVDEILEEYCNE